MHIRRSCLRLISFFIVIPAFAQQSFHPGSRTVMDAHNCYPYGEWWDNRIDRALTAKPPLAIEQDPYWYVDPSTGQGRSVVAHGAPLSGYEPTLEHYFFDRVRPIMEKALQEGNHGDWPLITLNLDFKTEQPDHLAAVWELLNKYRDWITTAPKSADASKVEPLDIKPLLVLTGDPTRNKLCSTIKSQLADGCLSSERYIQTSTIPWLRRR